MNCGVIWIYPIMPNYVNFKCIITVTFNLVVKRYYSICNTLSIGTIQNSAHHRESHDTEYWLRDKTGETG